MSNVKIEYEEKPIKKVTAITDLNKEVFFSTGNGGLTIVTYTGIEMIPRHFDKQTAIDLVQALNQLVKQL